MSGTSHGPLPDRRITVGLGLYTGQRSPGEGRPRYADAPRLARAAEEAGFDAFWVSERMPDDYLPAPLTLLAALATGTERIALGCGLAVAPLHHPLRLAEDAAVVDQLSGGRLLLGLGIGYAEHEYRAFGVDPRTRGAQLEDLVPLLRTAWRGEPFDWNGPALHADGVACRPRPWRGEGIPIWLGGYAKAALHRAGRIADGYLMGRSDKQVLDGVLDTLDAAHPRPDFTLALNMVVILTGDDADEASARAGLARQQTAYDRIRRTPPAGRLPTPPSVPLAPDAVDEYVQALGSPARVASIIGEILERLSGRPRVHVMLRALFPEPSLDLQLARITRLGRELLPHLR